MVIAINRLVRFELYTTSPLKFIQKA